MKRNISLGKQVNGVFELLEEFTRNKLVYKQVVKTDSYYVYEICDTIPYYEVFTRRLRNLRKRTECALNSIGNTEFKYVKYPSDEDFGKWAWTARTMDKINEIIKRENI